MKFGFQNRLLKTLSEDGWHFQLLEWLEYHGKFGERYRTKTDTDGGSTPWWLWWLIPPFGKNDWWSFVLHDGCFRDSIERWDFRENEWIKWTPTESESNDLIHDALISQGYGWWKTMRIYIALKWFGFRAFDEDRKSRRR